MINRVLEGFTESLTNLDKFPAGGYGLGIGTNVELITSLEAPHFFSPRKSGRECYTKAARFWGWHSFSGVSR